MHTRTIHAFSSERREQRRVDVEDAALVGSHNSRWDHLQVAGQQNGLNVMIRQALQHLATDVCERTCISLDHIGVPADRQPSLERRRPFPVR